MRNLFLSTMLVVATSQAALAAGGGAAVGADAPAFTLKDLGGKSIALADYKNKTVVLEWFNPECPYVRASHTKGSLVDTAKQMTSKGVVWLAVNSAAPGRQGAGVDKNREAQKAFGLEHPILLDENGEVGKAYGATNTPHMYVIAKGKLVYRGAIDNSPDGEKGEPQGGTLVNYVTAALDDVAAGRPVRTAETKAYGCGVKYAK